MATYDKKTFFTESSEKSSSKNSEPWGGEENQISRAATLSYLKCIFKGFPGGSVVKNPLANARDMGSIPGLGRSPGIGNPLWLSCLGNPTDRGAWWATVNGIAKSQK